MTNDASDRPEGQRFDDDPSTPDRLRSDIYRVTSLSEPCDTGSAWEEFPRRAD